MFKNKLHTYYVSNRFLCWTILIFTLIYSLITFVNHYFFRTYALDLGLYTNALYDYTRFKFNDSLVFKDSSENLLGDHFDLYLPLFSPFSLIFGSYTLLIIQLVSILFGGIGIFRYVEHIDQDKWAKRSALLFFLLFYGIFSAVAFDYHSNVVASMLVPWFLLMLKKANIKWAWILLLLILISKENMSIWMFFVCTGLIWIHRKNRTIYLHLIFMSIISIIYAILVIGVIMPSFTIDGTFPHFKYSVLGTNFKEAFITIFTSPIETIKLLFTNHTNEPYYDPVKPELWIFLAITGFLIIFRPIYIWMLLPILGQKLFHNGTDMWGVHYQYSVEFAPILAIANYEVIKNFSKIAKGIFMILLPVLSLSVTIRLMDNTHGYVDKARLRIYKKAHYNREFSITEAHQVLKMIPKEAVVSAQSAFVPHLALRDTIYTFPEIANASYLLISPVDNPYPIDQVTFFQKIDEINQSGEWEAIHKSDEIILYKRIQ